MPIYANRDRLYRGDPFIEEELEDTGLLGEFGKGVGAGVDQLQGLIGGGGKALIGSLVGSDDMFYEGMQYYQEQMDEAAENEAAVGRIEDIDGLGDFALYASYMVGNFVPSLAGGGFAGAVGKGVAKKALNKQINKKAQAIADKEVKDVAERELQKKLARDYAQTASARAGNVGLTTGAVGFAASAGAGESFTRIWEETGEERVGVALATGLTSGALDALTPMRVLKKMMPDNAFKKARESIGDGILSDKRRITRALKEGAKTGGVEGVTEMMQEVVQSYAVEFVKAENDPTLQGEFLDRMFDEDKQSMYANAFVAGLVGGKGIGLVQGGLSSAPKVAPKKEDAEPEPDLPVEPETTAEEVSPEQELARARREKQLKAAGIPTEERPRGKTPQEAIDKTRREQGIPMPDPQGELDVGDTADPDLIRRRQKEARLKVRAQLDGMPRARSEARRILQINMREMEDDVVNPPAPEPTLPENVTPPLEQMVGKDVDYQGVKGILQKTDDGYVVVSEQGDILVESGEFQSPEELGIRLTDGAVEFERDIEIDPKTKKFDLRGKTFTLTRIVRDADGNPLSLAVRDDKGKKKTIRTKEIVDRINGQLIPKPNLNNIMVEFDELPIAVQKQMVVSMDAEAVTDQVSGQQALEVAQTLPDAEALTEQVNQVVENSFTALRGQEVFDSESKYTQSVRRGGIYSLAEAIKEVNAEMGSNRTPINEEKVLNLLKGEDKVLSDGSSIKSVENSNKKGIAEEVANALVDLYEAGLPKSIMNSVNGIYVHDASNKPLSSTIGTYSTGDSYISLNEIELQDIVRDANDDTDKASRIRYTLAHEIGHAFDIVNDHTFKAPEWAIELDGVSSESVTLELGSLIGELARNYQQKTELGKELSYPFGYSYDWITSGNVSESPKVVGTIQKEAFAQAFAVFHANPELLQKEAPQTYDYLNNLLRTTERSNESNNQTRENDTQLGEVQGEVRTPTEPRSAQVEDESGAGGLGGDSPVTGQASEVVGGETEREDGRDTGRPVQLTEEDQFEADLIQQELGDPDILLDDDEFLNAPVSTRFPTAVRSTEDPIANVLVNDYDSFVSSEDVFAKNMLLVKKYNNLTKREQRLSDKNAASALIEHIKNNLLYIYDAVPKATRAISKLWYKGANKIVQRMADKHGISLAQASAVAANLSPQKDWYQNASLAERVMDIFHNEQASGFDSQMKDKAEEIFFHKDVSKKARVMNRRLLDIIGDRSLQEIIAEDASNTALLGMWIRTWDQTYNDPSYRLVSPDGKFLDYAVNADGKTQSRVAWGSLNEIGKAVSVLIDGSQENISKSLGTKNKVRNFYNNIFAPDSADGFVTIDTHAVAAGLLKPLSGDSLEVSHNFGTGKGTSSSIVTGHSGTYSIFEEAYRQAARDRGVLAREMQSITWEAVRGLFTSTYKAQEQNVVFVEGVWNQYNKGKLSLEEARAKIYEHSRGIQKPDWERPDSSVPDEVSGTSYQRKLSDGSVPRQDARSQEAAGSGVGIDASRVLADQLNAPQKVGAPNTKGIPKVTEAYNQYKAGEISRDDYDTIANGTITPYTFVPEPASQQEMFDALDARKREKINVEIADGENVGLRLDIPAYTNSGVWVPTIHGKATSHRATASITNADFTKTPQAKAEKVMEGGSKSPFAQIRGEFVNRTDEENAQIAEQALLDKNWTQVGFDPRRHSFFYDRATGAPILQATEVVQVGPLVLAKNAVKGKSEDFLFSPAEVVTDTAELNRAIREEEKTTEKIKSGASSWFRRNLTAKGWLPETVFDEKVRRDGELGAVELDIRQMLGVVDKAMKDHYAELTEDQLAFLNDALGDKFVEIDSLDIPSDLKEGIVAMRTYLDNLSKRYAVQLIEDAQRLQEAGDPNALAKADLIQTIAGNVGRYLNRSYRAFDDPNWYKKVPDDVLDNAREFLISNGSQNPERTLNEILKNNTAYDSMEAFISESKLGAKDLSILKKRKEIAPEILALLGEYKDPRINFVKSATKMSRLLFNHDFLNRVKAVGEGVFLFTKDTAPTEAYVPFAAEGSKAMEPLNGYLAEPEVVQAFKDALENEQLPDWYRQWVRFNGMVKYGKTVIAPTTAARNFMSAAFFTIANGHFNLSKIDKSLEVAGTYFSANKGSELEYLKRIKRLGVVYDTPYAGEMMDLLKDTNFGTDLNLEDGFKGKVGKVLNTATRAYQFGDDFWKIVGFENEVNIIMNAKNISREDAEPLAAQRIRDTYPTYSLVGRKVKALRRFPLLGTFVSFPAEIIRTQFNMLRYMKQDMADPDMAATVPRRALGFAMVSGGAYALQNALLNSHDVSEDEEEALRSLSPHWSRNSNIAITGRDNKGNLRYMDLTHLDPYAYFKKPINAILRDQPIEDAIVQAGQELLTPFFGYDISTATILQVWQNETATGGKVFNPEDTPENISADIGAHLFKGLAPSVTQNLNRTAKAMNNEVSASGRRYDIDDEMAAWVGFRLSTFDPKASLYFKTFEFTDAKRSATSLLTKTFRDPNEVTDRELKNAFNRSSLARKRAFIDMSRVVTAARRSGLSDTKIMTVLRSNGVTIKDARALIKGEASEWTMSDSTLKNSIKKSDLLFGEATGKEFMRRWEKIQEYLEEEI